MTVAELSTPVLVLDHAVEAGPATTRVQRKHPVTDSNNSAGILTDTTCVKSYMKDETTE
jgi:hypothetical protein